MPVEYQSVVPWGRSLEEYRAMFNLKDKDLKGRVLGCGDGPASFNAEVTRLGGNVTSYDPIYALTWSELKKRIQETYTLVMEQTRANQGQYVWDTFPDVEALGAARMRAMEAFLLDYEQGKNAGRYVCGELPNISPLTGHYDLALFSHFLFLYSENLSFDFHCEVLTAVLSLADEVRVFPLLDNNGQLSRHLMPVVSHLSARGYACERVRVPYEFQKNGNTMLVITKSSLR